MKTEKTSRKKSTSAATKTAAPAPSAPSPVALATTVKALEAIPDRMGAISMVVPEAPVAKAVTIPVATRHEVTTDVIAARAYTIWEQQGRPHGRDQENWLLAETQLKQEHSFTA